MLEQIKHNNDLQSVSYFNKTATGVDIKSTTIPIIGKIIASSVYFALILYEYAFSDIIENFIPKARMVPSPAEDFVVEKFSNSIDDILLKALDEAKKVFCRIKRFQLRTRTKKLLLY